MTKIPIQIDDDTVVFIDEKDNTPSLPHIVRTAVALNIPMDDMVNIPTAIKEAVAQRRQYNRVSSRVRRWLDKKLRAIGL